MSDDFVCTSRRKPSAPQSGLSALLFAFVRQSDHAHVRCELCHYGGWGVEAQFIVNDHLLIGRRFYTRALAVQWAELEREVIEKGLSGREQSESDVNAR